MRRKLLGHPTVGTGLIALTLTLLLCYAAGTPNVLAVSLPAVKKANPALHPFMGWSSWSAIRQKVDAHIVKAQARVMVARLKKFGYDYVNIDAGWQQGYDRYGRPKPNLKKFPGGMAPLANWLHHHGLKLGIYLRPGIGESLYQANDPIYGTHYTTRQIVYKRSRHGNTFYKRSYMLNFGCPGAMAYLQSCANLYASWGVDYIKLDYVGPTYRKGRRYLGPDCRSEVAHFALALSRCGRPIWLELSYNLNFKYAAFWAKYANGWRTNGDIESYKKDLTCWKNVMQRFKYNAKWAPYAGPGHWNDFDSLDIGNGKHDGLTPAERQTVMIFWCVECSPLCLGADLTHLTSGDFKIITNRAAIAIDQAGHPATPLSQKTPKQVWVIHNADGSCTVAMFNLAKRPEQVSVDWRQLGMAGPTATVKDLWAGRNLGTFSRRFSAKLPAHGSRLLRITPAK